MPSSVPSSATSPSASQSEPSCLLIGPVKGWYSPEAMTLLQLERLGLHLLRHGVGDLADLDHALADAVPDVWLSQVPSITACTRSM